MHHNHTNPTFSNSTKTNRQPFGASSYTRPPKPPYLASHTRARTTSDHSLRRSPSYSYSHRRNNSGGTFPRTYSQDSSGDGIPLLNRLTDPEAAARTERSPTRWQPDTQRSPKSSPLLLRLGPQSPPPGAEGPPQTPSGSSLLERLGPSTSSGSRLVDRIEDVGMEDMSGHGLGAGDIRTNEDRSVVGTDHNTNARMEVDCSMPFLDGSHESQDIRMYEGPDDDRSSRASEARVDALLASVLDMSDIEDTVNTTVSATALPQHPAPDALLIKPSSVPSGPTRPPSTISCPPADPPPPHPSAPVTQSQSRADLITFTRKLLVPAITENARRRDPDADWDVLTVGASAVVTDEMCERFIQQAIMARAQLAEHDSRETPVHTADGGKERESGEAAELKTLREGEGEDPKHRNAKASSLDGRQEGSSAARPPASSSNRDIAEYAAGPSQPRHVKPILEDSVTGRTAHELPPAGRRPGPADADAMPLSEIPYLLKRSSTAAATSQHSNSTDTRATLVDQPAKMTSPSMDRAPNPRVHEREMPLPQHRPNVLTLPVPGIWYAKEGRAYADVVEVEFSVDPEIAAAARRWARRREEFDADATHVSVHLLCLPNAVVSTILQSVPLDAPPARVAQLVWEAGTKWPRRGTLLATMNSGSPGVSRTYFPDDLEDGPLDVTNTIQQGANMLRIVQLGDISGHTFVLYAGVPTQEEKNRSAVAAADSRDWAAFILRTSSSLVARG